MELYREVARRLAGGERLALATVVARRGSAPREPGAKMAVASDGSLLGTVGGGYPEAQVVRAALEVIQTGRPRLLRLDLTADVVAAEGAICGGTMEVFVEALSP